MLVAQPGQTASYHGSSTTASKKSTTCHASTSATTQKSSNNTTNNNINNLNSAGSAHKMARPMLNKMSESSSSNTNTAAAATALMKTLSVRLNRGTEFLKGTMQKALIAHNNANNNSNNTATSNATSSTNTSSTKHIRPSSSLLRLYTVPPTATHRYPQERLQNDSTDSLHREMCHFKPIRSAPTTPWKCSSKSRGAASLKIPKASVATKINLNCDDEDDNAASVAAQCAALEGNIQLTTGRADEARHALFRPKPSAATLLTTVFTTPTHQSAFVCLVTAAAVAAATAISTVQMKQISSVQSRQSQRYQNLHKTRSTRSSLSAKSSATQSQKSTAQLSQVLLRNRPRQSQVSIDDDLVITRSTRQLRAARAAASLTRVLPLPYPKTKAAANKAKAKLKKPKAKIINLMALAMHNNSLMSVGARSSSKMRKRKNASDFILDDQDDDDDDDNGDDEDIDECTRPALRKRSRLSKDSNSGVRDTAKSKSQLNTRGKVAASKQSSSRCSPPLTRSRLKQMSHEKLKAALDYRHRFP